MDNRVVFFGSSPFSIPVLQCLITAGIPVAGVVTFPDRPVGRHLHLTPNPVKNLALANNLPVFENITDVSILPQKHYSLIGLVAAYGKFIPASIMNTINNQIYNIHPSLLPKYRGPSPLQQQILDGVAETGVTIIQLDNQMDHGPILAQTTVPITTEDTAVTLGKRLFEVGGNLFLDYLKHGSRYHLRAQDDTLATTTSKLTRQSGFINYEDFKKDLLVLPKQSSEGGVLSRSFRAFSPWPGVWSILPDGKKIKLVSINPVLVQIESEPKPRSWPLS